MRLRLREVLPPDLQPRVGELTRQQLVALRFASDAELPELTRDVLDTIPIPKNNASLAQLTVGVYQTSGQSADVGGITGDTYAGIAGY